MSDAKPAPEQEGREEPSMEEILSSIRKIIASDEDEGVSAEALPADAGKAPEAEKKEPEKQEEDEVLELTEVVAEESVAEKPAEEDAAGDADEEDAAGAKPLESIEQEAERELEASAEKVELAPVEEGTDSSGETASMAETELLSESAAAAATGAFAKLARSVAREEPQPGSGAEGPTIEAFLAELVKPMLKEWLDANLPAIVERVVEREVKKLARRAELM